MSPTALRPAVMRARQLRQDMSLPEVMLWQRLRQRPNGLKFRRQHPVGPYVADFCCLSHKLIVEIDGFVHDTGDQAARDTIRTEFLEGNGFTVMRLAAQQVLADVVGTVEAILVRGALPLHHPSGGPPPRAGEET